MKSSCIMRSILDFWHKRLALVKKEMLWDYSCGSEIPDEWDPFPGMGLNIEFTGLIGPLLTNQKDSDFHVLIGKLLHKMSAQGLNKRQLSGRTDIVWGDKLKVKECQKPIWRVFYKPLLNKRIGNVQWRILHRGIAVNSFVPKVKKDASEWCPFYPEIETIFYMFLECKWLEPERLI